MHAYFLAMLDINFQKNEMGGQPFKLQKVFRN